MSTANRDRGIPLTSVDQLVDFFHKAGKPRTDWLFGTEHEMCGVYDDGSAPGYEGDRGIGAVLDALQLKGWAPIREDENVIALSRGDSQVTIEPGGQLEHAARPVRSADEMASDVRSYVDEVCRPSRAFGIRWLAVGFRPFGSLDDVPWMPKGRYRVMRDYLPTRGSLAREMMKRTATVQVNLDWADEEDAAAKLKCTMSVTSILTALYANSAIVNGKVSDYQTYRAEIWRDTDPDRCGLLEFAFRDGDLFRNYVNWAVDVPMFFVYRGSYVPAGGMTFGQFMRDGFQGHRATMDDWELHLSTLFPEARMKKYMEVRGCDAGPIDMILALAPLCRGFLYDETSLHAATQLTSSLSFEQRLTLQTDVARQGMAASVGSTGRTVLDLARELVAIAKDGLSRIEPLEVPYLEPLEEIASSGRTLADRAVDVWRASNGDVQAMIAELAYPEFGNCAD